MSLDIPNLSRRVSPAGNVNIAGREMLDSLFISTQITTRDVEWMKQWLQARYNDEDLFYARHRIQGQPSFEEYVDFIKQYEAELTNELAKSRIELESNSRFFQTLPYAFPNRNSYVDELKNENDKLTLQNDQFRRKEAQLSTEIDQLKGREAQLSTEIDQVKGREAQLSTEIDQVKGREAQLSTEIDQVKGREAQLSTEMDQVKGREAQLSAEIDHLKGREAQLSTEIDQMKGKEAQLSTENDQLRRNGAQLANENCNLKKVNAKLIEKIDKMMTGMVQMFFKWQTEL
ncbi:unnamed protein product [Mytilus coruscus]|uniref:Uncharacterized protein n=1 Tax=Mytilus coruscus TaxID=42192 RepID=A0A6J8CHM1_MYTCO|nr:unnamed protein product [Mytilus coruscus]